jgi:glutamate/aspartate transport system permease protein
MEYNWRWSVLIEQPYTVWLLQGLAWTLILTVSSWLIAFGLGVLVGSARTADSLPVRVAAGAYIEFFRGIPLIVQLFLWFFVLPEVLPAAAGAWLKRDLPYPELVSAILCLGLYTSARVSEQVRAGIGSISQGTKSAAVAAGLSPRQQFLFVIIPLALRNAIPTLTSEFLALLKNSSVALTIGFLELTAQARRIENYTFQAFESFAAATAIYLSCAALVVAISRFIEHRFAIVGTMGAK